MFIWLSSFFLLCVFFGWALCRFYRNKPLVTNGKKSISPVTSAYRRHSDIAVFLVMAGALLSSYLPTRWLRRKP